MSLESGGDNNTGMGASSAKFSGEGSPSFSGPAAGAAVATSSKSASSAASAQARSETAPAAAGDVTAGGTAAYTPAGRSKTAEPEGVDRSPRDVGIEDGDGGGTAGAVDAGGVVQGDEGPGMGDAPVEEEEERKDGSVDARVSQLILR